MAGKKNTPATHFAQVPPGTPIPVPDAEGLKRDRKEAIGLLDRATRAWRQLHRDLALAGTEEQRQEALAVGRALAATLAVLSQGEKEARKDLSKYSRGVLEKARDRQEKKDGRWMVPIPELGYAHRLMDLAADAGPGGTRTEFVDRLQSTLAHWLEREPIAHTLTGSFLGIVELHPDVLRELGIEGTAPAGKYELVRKKFEKILEMKLNEVPLPEIAEALITHGMMALGVGRERAKSLFDAKEKREGKAE